MCVQHKRLTQIIHRKQEWIIGPRLSSQYLDPLPCLFFLIRLLLRTMPIIQQRRKQRCWCNHRTAPLRQRQRRVLMPQQISQQTMCASHASLCSFSSNPNSHRQRVDEKSHPTVGSCSTLHPSKQHRPEHHVLAPAHPRQHLPPCHMKYTRCAHTKLPGSLSNSACQSRVKRDPELLNSCSVKVDVQQSEGCCRLLHISQHLPEKPFVLLPAHSQPRLRHKVPERLRRRQTVRTSQQISLNLLLPYLQRALVCGQIVQQLHQQPTIISRVIGDIAPQQRRFPYVNPAVPWIETTIQLLSYAPYSCIQLHFLYQQDCFPPHHLHWLSQP